MIVTRYAIPVYILISALVLVHQAEEYEAPTTVFGQEDPSANRQTRQAANPSPNSPSSADAKDSAESTDPKNANEETLNGIKCDFGTAETPDLCKFKITEPFRAKSLSKWTLGSGRFALYQGGPLMDAGEGNDTSGGYIFYETTSTTNLTTTNSHSNQMSSNYQTYETFGHIYGNKRGFSSVNYAQVKPNDQNIAEMQEQTQQQPFMNLNLPGSLLISPNLTAPGPSGMCLSFQYIIHGLSADELRVHVNDHKTERIRQIWAVSESEASNWTRGEILYPVTNVHSIVFSTFSSSQTKLEQQQRKFRGYIALDKIEINKQEPTGGESSCKGHCNLDGDLCGWTNAENQVADDFDWSFGRGSENLFTGPTSDFVSSMNNELTGSYLYINSGFPHRPGDKAILMSPTFQPTTVNEAMCMRFAVHMFGSGIGSLTIKIRYTEDVAPAGPSAVPNNNAPPSLNNDNLSPQPRSEGKTNDIIIWEMFGDAGNNWHQAQTSVSSSKSSFQILIEGEVGENHLGDIAIDEISFSSGPCPTSPPVASKNYGDCTFEQSMCYWRNPEADVHIDDLDWIRSVDDPSIHGPNIDHTIKKRSGAYLKLENTFREPKSGTRAFLLSPIFEPKTTGSVQCLSFYYYMFMRTIGSSGPNLGTIRIYLASNNELTPIWRLTNPISSPVWRHGRVSLYTNTVEGQPVAPTKLFQIAFEGIWGDARGGAIALDDITVFDGACDIMPAEAKSVPLECSFDVDLCTWTNRTSDVLSQQDPVDQNNSPFLQSVNSAAGSSSARNLGLAKRMSWQLATVESRPVNLQDHTYKAPIGYVYVDVLDNSGQQMKFSLQSSEMVVPVGQQNIKCLSFWFAAYGRQELNQLSVHMTQASFNQNEQDSGSGKSNQQTGTNNQRLSPDTTGPVSSGANADSDSSNAWKNAEGKLLWAINLRNVTESKRRRWQYGQVALKVDSNFMVKFRAVTSDGGFALDDLSFYDGSCETRPSVARIKLEEDEETTSQPIGQPKNPS